MSVPEKLYQIAGLAYELTEEWEADGNKDADTFKALWPFSTPEQGMSIDEWAAEVQALADEYATSAEVDTTAPGWVNPDPEQAGPILRHRLF